MDDTIDDVDVNDDLDPRIQVRKSKSVLYFACPKSPLTPVFIWTLWIPHDTPPTQYRRFSTGHILIT